MVHNPSVDWALGLRDGNVGAAAVMLFGNLLAQVLQVAHDILVEGQLPRLLLLKGTSVGVLPVCLCDFSCKKNVFPPRDRGYRQLDAERVVVAGDGGKSIGRRSRRD